MKRRHLETTNRISVPANLVFDYELRKAPNDAPRELIILLHGFAESGKRIYDKLISSLPETSAVLAPNGPFPMAIRMPEGSKELFKLVYSWYFYDPGKKEYFIDMAIALQFLKSGIEKLGYKELPKRVIGFSQGGYLAPIAAQHLGKVTQVVGLACEYLSDEISMPLDAPLDFRVDGIHGKRDETVSVASAKLSHESLLKTRKADGRFCELPETTHKIDDEMRKMLKRIIDGQP